MILNLYSVQDVLTSYAEPFAMANDEGAKRAYNDFLKTASHPEDMRLWKLGTYNTETGEINQDKKTFKCIQGGGFTDEI